MSATELTAHCDASLATVTRRLDALVRAELVGERTRPRADGHHDTVYAARLERVEVRLVDGDFEFDIARCERDMADELARLWGRFP